MLMQKERKLVAEYGRGRGLSSSIKTDNAVCKSIRHCFMVKGKILLWEKYPLIAWQW